MNNKCEEMKYRLDYDQQLLSHISHKSHILRIKLYSNLMMVGRSIKISFHDKI